MHAAVEPGRLRGAAYGRSHEAHGQRCAVGLAVGYNGPRKGGRIADKCQTEGGG